MNNAIELAGLAAPDIIEPLNYQQIYEQMQQTLQTEIPDFTSLPSDPVNKLLELTAYRELLLRQRVNDAARSVMLAFAQGKDLDHLGALFGVARKSEEGDERYRERIPLSLESYSMAGTMGAYQYQTLSASKQVKDVFVDSTKPGIVDVHVLAEQDSNGPAVKGVVEAHLNDEDIRPLTDKVIVHLVEPTRYSIEARIFFNVGVSTEPVKLAIHKALDTFIREHFRLGKELPYSGIIDALHQPGVRKVTLISPTKDFQAQSTQAYLCGQPILSYPEE
ncbi:baseplate assembly protein [Pseudoalteromonas xiamenensis]|uniref:baseplate assembly protein n=1 Tax=Pseudoalteromonas xiamenensis TaxID=882626 RepID=UPI0035EB8D22